MANQLKGTIVLPRQTTPYTCGAACLAAVARLVGKPMREMDIADTLQAKPVVGIDNGLLGQFAVDHLDAIAFGEDVYDDHSKLAIWNILNPISGVGHYVVVIGVLDGVVTFYDPYYANTLHFYLNEIHWKSGDGAYKNWAAVFPYRVDSECFHGVGESDATLGVAEGEPVAAWCQRSISRWIARHLVRNKAT